MVMVRDFPAYTAHADTDTPPRTEPPTSLDDLIGETRRLLSEFRTLSPAERRALTKKMRILTNYSEGWGQRGGMD